PMRLLPHRRRRRTARRKFQSYFRPLRVEPLESRLPLATLTVTTLVDETDGRDTTLSLREAIESANADPGGDIIQFKSGLTGTINLVGQLSLRKSMTITGPGASLITVAGNHTNFSVFFVTDLTTFLKNITISGLTITGGSQTVGGGIQNQENLT